MGYGIRIKMNQNYKSYRLGYDTGSPLELLYINYNMLIINNYVFS